MNDFRDPGGRARIAVIAVVAHIVAEFAAMTTALVVGAPPAGETMGLPAAIVAMVEGVALIASMVTVAMWIYRVNANAHSFADGLSITAGWDVGWFFVPFANLWKPFEGVKETWQASHDPVDWPLVPVPALLRVWWGCWLVANIVGNLSFRLSNDPAAGPPLAILNSILSIAAAAALIRIIGQLTDAQRRAHTGHVFA